MRDELKEKLLLPPEGSRVLCAVSGGADSMCLLSLLCGLGVYTVAAAHFEHGIRGGESLRDCAFVSDYCAARGILCFTEHADVPRHAAENGLGLEEAARELRYAFLERVAAREGYDLIATAHNADDNAETMLLNLARGASAAGLCGIPPRRGKIIRPLLGLTRAEIEQLLDETGTPHVEDSSNTDEAIRRNRIRRTVMPVLHELNPAFSAAAARTAAQLRRDEDFLSAQAEAFIRAHDGGDGLPTAELMALHEAVSSRVVHALLGPGAEEKHVSAVLALCRGSERRELFVPGHRVLCERGRLMIDPDDVADLPETELVPGQSVVLPEAGLEIRCALAGEAEIHNSFKTYRLKYESIGGKISFSSPRPGERYRVAHRGCTKTLKSLFAERGMTGREKRLTPVFRDGKGIVLVPPFGVSERCLPDGSGGELLIMIKKQ